MEKQFGGLYTWQYFVNSLKYVMSAHLAWGSWMVNTKNFSQSLNKSTHMYWPLLSTTWPPHTLTHWERETTTHMAYFKTRFVVFFQPLDNYTSFLYEYLLVLVVCSFFSRLFLFLWLSLVQCNFLTDVVISVFCFFSFQLRRSLLISFRFVYSFTAVSLFYSFLVILSFYYKRRPIQNHHPLDPRLRSRLKIARTHTYTDSCIGLHIVVHISIFTSNHSVLLYFSIVQLIFWMSFVYFLNHTTHKQQTNKQTFENRTLPKISRIAKTVRISLDSIILFKTKKDSSWIKRALGEMKSDKRNINIYNIITTNSSHRDRSIRRC